MNIDYNNAYSNMLKDYFDTSLDNIIDDIFKEQQNYNVSSNAASSNSGSITTNALPASTWYPYVTPSDAANGQWTYDTTIDTTIDTAISAESINVGGKSLTDVLDQLQKRLAILDDPDPEKLEKFAALKKAYEQYKLLEKLCFEQGDNE